jgi:isochorismate pyruvate lyase
VDLLAERQKYVISAAQYKADEDAVRAPDRRRSMMERLNKRAVAAGVNAEVVERVYVAMIDAFIDVELRKHRS